MTQEEFKQKVINKITPLSKYNSESGCIEYTGNLNKCGYGTVSICGRKSQRSYLVHRLVAYLNNLLENIADSDDEVYHSCDNPKCINIKHLYTGDRFLNQQHSVLKGRHVNTRKTHCKWGHSLSGYNLYEYRFKGKIKRACKICKANRKLKQNRKMPSVVQNELD